MSLACRSGARRRAHWSAPLHLLRSCPSPRLGHGYRSARHSVVVAVGALVLATSACAMTASKPAVRAVVPGPSHDSELLSVSCAGPTSCQAVGVSSADQMARVARTLVESYRGRRWSISSAPSPGSRSVLSGVSCPTPRFCQAVGYTVFGSQTQTAAKSGASPVLQVPLAERYDGARWRVEPFPGGVTGMLRGVSCPTPSFCVAVGQRGGSTALIETWNGRSWMSTPTGLPPGTSDLQGVSCPSPHFCVAVGSQDQATLVEATSGARWSVMPSPNGPTTFYSTLSGVSCNATPFCMAVGFYYVSKAVGTVPFSVTYNGTSWSAVPGRRPLSGELSSVACLPPHFCVAVGVTFEKPDGANLVEMLDASGLTPQVARDPSATQPGLAGVACVVRGRCVAVGSHYAGNARYLTTVEMTRGSQWAVVPSPNVTGV